MTMPDLSANWPGRNEQSLVWLASYPRSGNTFTRILLANYFSSSETPYDINRLRDFVPSDTNQILWENARIETADSVSSETLWKSRPAVIEHFRNTQGRRPLPGIKSHTANVRIFNSDGFGFRPDDRAIYIVRHPLDVQMSRPRSK
jgi:hypothetical protein